MSGKIRFEDYFNNSRAEFDIPDIRSGFIPQGLSYDESTNSFLITGYMGNGKHSPIYIIDKKTGSLKRKILMLTEKGEKYNRHCGGISVYGDYAYVAGSTDACMYSYSIEEMISLTIDSTLKAKQKLDLKKDDDYIRVSFTSKDDSLLYAGEFQKGLIFYTAKKHRVKLEDNVQKAYLFGFKIDENGIVIPICVYSIPEKIQGASFSDGYLYLSRSRSFLCGDILTYSLDSIKQFGTQNVLGYDIPIYILDEKNAIKITEIPLMSEELVVVDGRLYIIYESASNRYRIGRLFGLDKVYSTPIEYFR